MASGRPGRLPRLVGIVACVGVASGYLLRRGMPVDAVGYGLGTPLASLCSLPVPRSRLPTKLALLTPGIDLIHPFASMVVRHLAPTTPSFWAYVLAGTVGGGAAAWALKRNAWTKSLV